MKKIIGIIGVMALSIGMFMSSNTVGALSSNLDLNSLLSINPAEACPESQASSANAVCTISDRCRYDTSARECHL
ncbi:hypothetical protein KO529_01520 [Arenibacter algicola]|nr:hypothetical protein [Arenibacter algicola]